MKKLLVFMVAIVMIIMSSCAPKKENLTGDVKVPKPLNEKTFENNLTLTKLDSSKDINIEDIKSLGFKECILESTGLRIDSGNFKTDFKRKNKLLKQTSLLEKENIPYYIEVTSGPGVSPDRKNLSLYENQDNIVYFAQMINEIISMQKENSNFNGIIINIASNNISDEVYYNTLNKIINKVNSDKEIIITLCPLYFNSKDPVLPTEYFDKKNIGFNINMDIICENYPGNAKLNGLDVSLSKNTILENLVNIKNLITPDTKVIVSVKCSWSSGFNVLLKDIFEIMKIINFDFAFSYSNTDDEYDFSNNQSIVNILNKY